MSAKLNVVFLKGETPEVFELFASNIKEVVSLLRLQKGDEFVNELLDNKYKFVLANSKEEDNFVALVPEVVFSTFEGFDTLFIVPEVEGEEPITVAWTAAAMSIASTTGMTVATTLMIMNTIALMAASIGLNMLMSALSPTPEFSQDPAAQQNKSNLFNGAPIVRNQGGSVPLIFGNPYAGAVLISSGSFTEEVTV